jgi:ubiquinone/menaquinone biosynthesis C-methylase UbiE
VAVLAAMLAAALARAAADDATTHHAFDDVEHWVRIFDDPKRAEWQRPRELVAALGIRPGMRVADVGAGTGYFLPRLAAAVGQKGRVLGLDVEDAMVAYMTKRAERAGLLQVVAKKVAADDPGLGERSVDRVLVVDTWHHLGDRRAYSAKLARALAPGGFVLVVDFKKESRRGPPAEAKLTPDEVIADLAAGGLTALLVDGDPLPDQFVVIGRK